MNLGNGMSSKDPEMMAAMEEGLERRLQKAGRELIAKDRARTAARREREAREAEEARTHVEVERETFDCNAGRDGIVAKTALMQISKKELKEAEETKKAQADRKHKKTIKGKSVVKKTSKEEEEEEEEEGSEEDDDEYLDDYDALEAIRAKRLAQLKAKKQRRNRNRAMGEYREIVEPEFLKTVTKNKHAIVHFYHREFERCKIMDMHLRRVAYRHDDVTFVKLDAQKAPFFITKLKIKTLPTVVLFIDGVAVDRVVGFEELDGGRDTFRTRSLERRVKDAGLIKDLAPHGYYPDDDASDSDEG
eukprot:g3746.t1